MNDDSAAEDTAAPASPADDIDFADTEPAVGDLAEPAVGDLAEPAVGDLAEPDDVNAGRTGG